MAINPNLLTTRRPIGSEELAEAVAKAGVSKDGRELGARARVLRGSPGSRPGSHLRMRAT